MGLSSFKLLWWAPNDVCNVTEPLKVNSGSSEVIDFGTNRKRLCDFLLVINSNLGTIFHRFRDMVVLFIGRKIAKIASSYPPQSQKSPHSGWPLSNFVINQIFPETRMSGLSDGEKNHDASFLRFHTILECDRQTDSTASAVIARGRMSVCLSVSLSVCHTPVLYRKRRYSEVSSTGVPGDPVPPRIDRAGCMVPLSSYICNRRHS